MVLQNYTPFIPAYFESRDIIGHDFGVLVLRGTFDMVAGALALPRAKQAPIIEADVYLDDTGMSSLRYESDFSPFKPSMDIHVHGTALAPGGRPLADWVVRVGVGGLEKRLRVTGPRYWVRENGTYRLTDPEPTLHVPICYEKAFGGIWKSNWGETRVFEENPVGLGYTGEEIPSYLGLIPAPQIESLEDPISEIGKVYKPQGLGPIARSWLPRRKLAGTFDSQWRLERWPELPLDFDYRFFQSAHPDLVYPGHPDSLLDIEVDGLLRSPMNTILPSYSPSLIAHPTGELCRFVLDTLIIDCEEGTLSACWRAKIVHPADIDGIECFCTSG